MAEGNSALSCCCQISHTLGLLQLFLKIYTDAADHFPFILISFVQEAFFSPNTPFLPEEVWFTLEDVSVRMSQKVIFKMKILCRKWFSKTCEESSLEKNPSPIKILFFVLVLFGFYFNVVFILWRTGVFIALNKYNCICSSHSENIPTKYCKNILIWQQ